MMNEWDLYLSFFLLCLLKAIWCICLSWAPIIDKGNEFKKESIVSAIQSIEVRKKFSLPIDFWELKGGKSFCRRDWMIIIFGDKRYTRIMPRGRISWGRVERGRKTFPSIRYKTKHGPAKKMKFWIEEWIKWTKRDAEWWGRGWNGVREGDI